jgi:hypothetical protein
MDGYNFSASCFLFAKLLYSDNLMKYHACPIGWVV